MSNTKNKPVNWLKLKHGDQVTLQVSIEDQINGIRRSPTNCAVVQTLMRSSPDVYNAKVVEGNTNIWIHGKNNRDWRGRLIPDNATRELAMKYDDNLMSAPTIITLIVDKFHEVSHYKRTPPSPPILSRDSNNNESGSETELEVQREDSDSSGKQTEVFEQELAQKKQKKQQRQRKNRWDISGYLVPANVE